MSDDFKADWGEKYSYGDADEEGYGRAGDARNAYRKDNWRDYDAYSGVQPSANPFDSLDLTVPVETASESAVTSEEWAAAAAAFAAVAGPPAEPPAPPVAKKPKKDALKERMAELTARLQALAAKGFVPMKVYTLSDQELDKYPPREHPAIIMAKQVRDLERSEAFQDQRNAQKEKIAKQVATAQKAMGEMARRLADLEKKMQDLVAKDFQQGQP
jgi:uncharacterized coiled-coil protein SlyX